MEYANHEQDIIRQAFSTGNYTWMKESLPVEMGRGAQCAFLNPLGSH